MERETKIITTTGDHKVVLKTYVTGREMRQINEVFLRDIQMEQKGTEQSLSGFKGEAIHEAENIALKTVVVSVDGQTGNILDAILDLPSDDYQEILEAVNDVTGSKKKDT